jgi:flagellar assembly protein FliH
MIVPDHSVQDQGCVIKTAFGSVDARVETQLTEIRQALLDLCLREEPHEP